MIGCWVLLFLHGAKRQLCLQSCSWSYREKKYTCVKKRDVTLEIDLQTSSIFVRIPPGTNTYVLMFHIYPDAVMSKAGQYWNITEHKVGMFTAFPFEKGEGTAVWSYFPQGFVWDFSLYLRYLNPAINSIGDWNITLFSPLPFNLCRDRASKVEHLFDLLKFGLNFWHPPIRIIDFRPQDLKRQSSLLQIQKGTLTLESLCPPNLAVL